VSIKRVQVVTNKRRVIEDIHGMLRHASEIKPSSFPARSTGGVKSSGKIFYIPSLLALGPSVRPRKSVQKYLVSHGSTTSTFSKRHGGVRSWLPETPSTFLRSTGLLE